MTSICHYSSDRVAIGRPHLAHRKAILSARELKKRTRIRTKINGKTSTPQSHRELKGPDSQMQVGSNERLAELSSVLLCSNKGLRVMARRYPPLLRMDPEDLLHRMLALKAELPECDIAGMLYNQPFLFLCQSSKDVVHQVSQNYKIFSGELPELVDSVVQERPAVLFIDGQHLEEGLPHVKSVSKHAPYPTDSTSCANLLWSFFGRSVEDKYNRIF